MKNLISFFIFIILSMGLNCCEQRFIEYDEQPAIRSSGKFSSVNNLNDLEKLYNTLNNLNNLNKLQSNGPTNLEKVFKNHLILQKRPILQQWGPNGKVDHKFSFFFYVILNLLVGSYSRMKENLVLIRF